MIIRTQQIEQLRANAQTRFVDSLMAHFAPLWPDQVKALGGGYRGWIEQGVQAAGEFGITSQQLVARFINLWFVWDRDFERRLGFEWAAEILNDTERSAFVKIHQLSYRTRLELEAAERKEGEPVYERSGVQR